MKSPSTVGAAGNTGGRISICGASNDMVGGGAVGTPTGAAGAAATIVATDSDVISGRENIVDGGGGAVGTLTGAAGAGATNVATASDVIGTVDTTGACGKTGRLTCGMTGKLTCCKTGRLTGDISTETIGAGADFCCVGHEIDVGSAG